MNHYLHDRKSIDKIKTLKKKKKKNKEHYKLLT